MPSSDTIDSVETALEVLETVGELGGAGVSELAAELDRSKSTVHRHLSTLRESGYVVADDGRYYTSLDTLRLAGNALNRFELYPLCKSVVNELVEETGESAAVAAEERGRAVYLYYNRTNEAVKTDARIGISLYLHCTGAGKAILAHLPDGRVDEILDRDGLPRKTANTITDRNELETELETIRETGISFDDEERLAGMRGIAAPILNRETDELYGAITIAGPTRRFTDQKFEEEFPSLLRQAASMIEVTLTYD